MMKKIIEWELVESLAKGKRSGTIKAVCPECRDSRSNKKDKALSINITKGLAKCHYCDAISFRKDNNFIQQKTYTLPTQDWKNHTVLSDRLVKYLEKERKISQSTIKELGVTQETYYQPQLGTKTSNLVFNYFEFETVVNKKYRDANKNFTQSKNGKSIFYNINSIIGESEVYIVEGEFDVLAMHECGYKNTISLPNGANDNDDVWSNCKKYLSDVKKFYICTDNDASGEEVSNKIAQRLGRYRCVRVVFDHKDANDELINKGKQAVQEAVKKAKHYDTPGSHTIEDLYDDILNLYDKGLPQTFSPKAPCFGDLSRYFSVMRGQLVVATGIPSHGKSNFVEWYVMNLINDHDMKASFFSPEHYPLELHQSTFVEKYHGKSFWYDNADCPRITKKEIEEYKEWAKEKIYITSPQQNQFPKWDWLLEVFKEQMFVYGIDVFVIDAYNKLEYSNTSKTELQNIREVLTKLTMFAQLNNVIIFLVAHPTKMTRNADNIYLKPTLYDISGSADFRNQAHSGFSIYRHFKDYEELETGISFKENDVVFTTEKVKMKYQGEMLGKEVFRYHVPSGRYYADDKTPVYTLSSKNTFNVTDLNTEQTINNIKPVSLDQAFQETDEDELPF